MSGSRRAAPNRRSAAFCRTVRDDRRVSSLQPRARRRDALRREAAITAGTRWSRLMTARVIPMRELSQAFRAMRPASLLESWRELVVRASAEPFAPADLDAALREVERVATPERLLPPRIAREARALRAILAAVPVVGGEIELREVLRSRQDFDAGSSAVSGDRRLIVVRDCPITVRRVEP